MAYDELSEALTVSQLNQLISSIINEAFRQVIVVGEVSNFRPSSSHWYFNLVDKSATIPVAVFKSMQYAMPEFKNGEEIIITGRVDYWEKGGKISLIAQRIMKKGTGEIALMLEKRRVYYQSLGYFDQERKRPMPKAIKRIGVVTSKSGAAIQDILRITKRRAPSIDIIILPTLVQGEGAGEEIAKRIRQANLFLLSDVLIVGRGGGSEEDLLPFSDEAVLEAIYNSSIPVVSAVGHEINHPLSDMVADIFASTPSAAAELVTEEAYRQRESLKHIKEELDREIKARWNLANSSFRGIGDVTLLLKSRIAEKEKKLEEAKRIKEDISDLLLEAEAEIAFSVRDSLDMIKERHQDLERRAIRAISSLPASFERSNSQHRERILSLRAKAESLLKERYFSLEAKVKTRSAEIAALSPLNTLERGYALIYDESGKLIKSAKNAKIGDKTTTRMSDGYIKSVIEGALYEPREES